MKNENLNNVSIPRWHYRDTQADVKLILEEARNLGSLRMALVNYLSAKQDKLPAGMTVEKAVDSILSTSSEFASVVTDGKTVDDIQDMLRENIKEMDSKQAIIYLAALETVFRSCDSVATGGSVTNPEKLQQELLEAAEDVEDSDVITRIEKLAEMILGDSLTAYIYASGNAELASIIKEDVTVDINGISEEAASHIHNVIMDNSKKTELYAVTACVCYGMVLDGKIEGVSAANLDAGVMTALVAAGQEKASILMRLIRGEIDKELAVDLLAALGKALKWTIVKLFQGLIFLSASTIGAITIGAILGFLGFVLSSGWWFFAIWTLACIGGFFIARDSKESIEEAIDLLNCLTMGAMALICGAVSWCWEKGKALVKSTTQRNYTQKRTQNV